MAFKGIPPETLTVYMRTPAARPPPEQTANFAHPPRLRYVYVGVFISLSLLATSLVAVRIYVRKFLIKYLWWDDCRYQSKSWVADLAKCRNRFVRPSMGILGA